jgi:electron transfer flavoprotein alpha/beta subunit
MHIIVCIKQVPDTGQVKINPETGHLIREGVPSIINPEDKNALEEAVRLKERHDSKITVISMGPKQAEDALREALAMGADEAILLTDAAFRGSDTWATSYTLSRAIKKIGDFDMILCGREALDGNTAQVGPQIAEFLDLASVVYAQKIIVEGDTVTVDSATEDGYKVVETKLPVLITAIKDLNMPRIPTLFATMEALEKEITLWTADDLGVDKEKAGIKGSYTRIRKTATPDLSKKPIKMVEGDLDSMCDEVVALLKKNYLF